MNRICSILILLLVVLSVSLKTAVWLHFEWNRRYIEKELCEQRHEEHNCCKGNCYLTKKLSNEPGKPAQAQAQLPKYKELCYCANEENESELVRFHSTGEHSEFKEPLMLSSFSNSIFHPPGFVVFT